MYAMKGTVAAVPFSLRLFLFKEKSRPKRKAKKIRREVQKSLFPSQSSLGLHPFFQERVRAFTTSYFAKNFSALVTITSMPMGKASSMGAKPPLWMGTSLSRGIFGSRQPSQMKALGTFSQ